MNRSSFTLRSRKSVFGGKAPSTELFSMIAWWRCESLSSAWDSKHTTSECCGSNVSTPAELTPTAYPMGVKRSGWQLAVTRAVEVSPRKPVVSDSSIRPHPGSTAASPNSPRRLQYSGGGSGAAAARWRAAWAWRAPSSAYVAAE